MYGLLGRKLSHSLSPQIHSYFGSYGYELFCRESEELDSFFEDESIDAFNVTIPYKIEAFERCDILSDTAKEIGSVNTVVRKGGMLYGYNTDLFGFEYMVKRAGAEFTGKKVLVLGSGGASKTAVASSKRLGAREVIVISRSGENNYENIYDNEDAQIIVNTTPVGMFPENGASPVSLKKFKHIEFVADLIYNPCMTALLIEASELGIPYTNGMPMLVAQGFLSSELFFDKKYDDGIIENALTDILHRMKNIVLIGMPGSGKTTAGKKLAALTGKDFADTDEIIVKSEGRSIPDIFEQSGEEYFRNAETAAVSECGKRLGIIIATGGGAVMRKENRDALRQNGLVIYLRRGLDELSREGRPLSSGDCALSRIFEERRAVYEGFADYIIDVDRDPEVTAERLLKCVSLY